MTFPRSDTWRRRGETANIARDVGACGRFFRRSAALFRRPSRAPFEYSKRVKGVLALPNAPVNPSASSVQIVSARNGYSTLRNTGQFRMNT